MFSLYYNSRTFKIILRGNIVLEVPLEICHQARDGHPPSFAGHTIAHILRFGER